MNPPLEIPGYELLDLIGEGGMALVYKARQRSLSRIVAVKVLRPELASDPAALVQFRLEANSVANLKHPNILMIHEAGVAGNIPYFIMEYVAAYSVHAWITRKGVLSVQDALTVSESVARALQYAWDKAGLVHGDLKPGNILVDEDGVVKVADFSGLSRSNLSEEAALLQSFTIGTPNFMAPEQAGGYTTLDFRADIYSLGAGLYQLVTGVMPFAAHDTRGAMQQQIEGFLDDPMTLNSDLPMNVALLIEKMMVKDRDHRYTSWEQVIADMDRVRNRHPPAPPLPFPGASTVRRTIQRSPAEVPATARPAANVFAPFQGVPAPMPSTMPKTRKHRIALLFILAVIFLLTDIALFLSLWKPKPISPLPIPPVTPVIQAPPPSVSPPIKPPEHPTVPTPGIPPVLPPVKPVNPVVPPTVPATPVPPPPPPPVVVPPPSTPVTPTDSAKEDTAVRLQQLRDRLALVRETSQLTRQGDFIRVRQTFGDYMAAHHNDDRNEWDSAARLDQERVFKVADAYAKISNLGRLPPGRKFTTVLDNTHEFYSISDGIVTAVRRLQAGTIQKTIPLAQLGSEDLLPLFKLVDEKNGPALHAAWSYLTTGQPPASPAPADSADATFLKKWVEDWQSVFANIQADNAINDLKKLVQDSRFSEASNLASRVKTSFSETDILKWARIREFEELSETIQEELKPAVTEPSEKTEAEEPSEPGTGGPFDPLVKPPPTLPPKGAASGEAVNLTLGELRADWDKYDGQTVRLRFRSRSNISRAEKGFSASTLKSGGDDIPVVFPDEGLRWIQDQPPDHDRRERIVFGVVDAAHKTVRLVGRTSIKKMGGLGYEYKW